MKKTVSIIVTVLAILAGGFFILNSYIYHEKQGTNPQASYKDISYEIDGQSIALINGLAEVEVAQDSASKTITRYFGNEAEGDLNSDGLSDVAFLLTQESGASGTFYYVVVALKTDGGYEGTNAIFLGDRIAPQTTEIRNGVVIVNYADRAEGEPMTARPSFGKSLYVTFDGEKLEAVDPLSKGEQVVWGSVVMGHEARTFTPCGPNSEELWIGGDSRAYREILELYRGWVALQTDPYAPLLMVLVGRVTNPPTDGFGADFNHGFEAVQIVKIVPGGVCK